MANSSGFTLLEIVVVVGIISAVTAYASIAYPSVRQQQKIIMAEQILQSTMRETQQKAINEERNPDCITEQAGSADKKHCSDLGLYFDGSKIVLFANTNLSDDNKYESDDYNKLGTVSLPDGVTISGLHSLLFKATPPSVKMYADGQPIHTTTTATIQIGDNSEKVTLGPYGQVSK